MKLPVGTEVNYVAAPEKEGGKSTVKKAKIIGDNRLAFDYPDNNHQAIAAHSLDGEVGTFHLVEEAKDVKESDSFKQPPAVAEPAVNGAAKK